MGTTLTTAVRPLALERFAGWVRGEPGEGA
jgi:hypothetical protein